MGYIKKVEIWSVFPEWLQISLEGQISSKRIIWYHWKKRPGNTNQSVGRRGNK
jgi:hypothetical protein